MTPHVRRRIIIGSILVLLVLAGFWLAGRIPRTMTIFGIAAFLAFGVQPLVVFLGKRRVSKPLAVAIVFGGLLVLLAVGLLVIIPATVGQVQGLAANVPTYAQTVQDWSVNTQAWVSRTFPMIHIPGTQTFNLTQLVSSNLGMFATTTLSSVGSLLLGTATALFVAFSSLVLAFFFLINDSSISEGFASFFPAHRRETARALASEISQTFGSYISGQVLVSAITGVAIGGLSAIVGFKYALILGIIAGVGYAIPIIGGLITQVIALVLCAPQGLAVIVWVQIIIFGIERISDNVLVPKIMGDSVGVSPIGVMFAVFAGGELFGLPGLLLGIPAAALVKILWRYFVAPCLHRELGDKPAPKPVPVPAPSVPESGHPAG